MQITSKDYNLPDSKVLTSTKAFDFSVWKPDRIYIVLGRSNNAKDSVFIEKAVEDNVHILKRPSGGESVILSPKTIIISVKMSISDTKNTLRHFEVINNKILNALNKLQVKNLNQRGISDISIGEKKILGSSIYRKPDFVFYHAVLNVSETNETIEKYLKHPKREPDYRKGRNHTSFVTSLKEAGAIVEMPLLIDELNTSISELSNFE